MKSAKLYSESFLINKYVSVITNFEKEGPRIICVGIDFIEHFLNFVRCYKILKRTGPMIDPFLVVSPASKSRI